MPALVSHESMVHGMLSSQSLSYRQEEDAKVERQASYTESRNCSIVGLVSVRWKVLALVADACIVLL